MQKTTHLKLGQDKPLNIIEVSRSNLISNYLYLSSLNPNIKVAPVVKSNAYGHGISIVPSVFDTFNCPFICTNSLPEANTLLIDGIKNQILITGFVSPENLKTKILPFSYSIFNFDEVIALNAFQPGAKVHIFVDTGMHREGVPMEDLSGFLTFVKTKTTLKIEGIMSHFAMAEKPDDPLTLRQIQHFWDAQLLVKNMGISPKWIHMANSSGLMNHSKYGNKLGNMARVGIQLYGLGPEAVNKKVKPVLAYMTSIALIKSISKGEPVGYDFTFKAQKNMTIATLPIGYFDGVDRRLSNIGFVSVNGTPCPIIGRVSMNITTIDITHLPSIKIGQKVTVISNEIDAKNSMHNIAQFCNTITNDIVVNLETSTIRKLV